MSGTLPGKRNLPGSKKVIARPFGTPMTIEGTTWLPAAELVAWAGFSWWAGIKKPSRKLGERLKAGALAVLAVLGSEWAHNLSHAAAARAVGKPMDELRVLGGMPRVTYYELNDRTVRPSQHICRALSGPVFNGLLWLLIRCLRRSPWAPMGLAGETLAVADGANTLITVTGLMPIPGLDGGAALKWGLVGAGKTPAEADHAIVKVNAGLSLSLAASACFLLRKKHWLWGGLAGFLSLVALGVTSGKIKEQ